MKTEMQSVGEPVVLGATWVDIQGEVYGAQPDIRGPIGGGQGYTNIVTRGDYTVSSPNELLAALGQAQPGQVIFIPGDAVLDFTVPVYVEELVIKIPAGVTLASDRGHAESKGALILSDTFKTCPLLKCMGLDIRISGIRLRGPDSDARLALSRLCFERGRKQGDPDGFDHTYYYKFANSDGIQTNYAGLTVDTCEISGWSHAAIFLMAGDRHQVHHNSIHHNQRDGLGYGICHDRAESLIEQNLFKCNRASIDGSGVSGSGYEARHNVELGQSPSPCHRFEIHGGTARKDGTTIAGSWLKIHHNTFRTHSQPIAISGVPEQEAIINNNWFHHYGPGSGSAQLTPVRAQGHTRVINNAYGPVGPQVLDETPAKPNP
jgi:hypothetical protein